MQKSISYTHRKGWEGMIGTSSQQVLRGAAGELRNGSTTATIPYGRAVVYGVGNSDVNMISAAGQKVIGIAVLNNFKAQSEVDLIAGTPPGYLPKEELTIITMGDVYMYSDMAVNRGDDVFVRHTAGVATDALVGRARKDAATGQAQALPNAVFRETITAPGLVLVSLGGV